MLNEKISQQIAIFSSNNISEDRKEILKSLVNYIKEKVSIGDTIRLNFICTHTSRRSHLSQIWAQTMAHHFNVKNVHCYSGGTEATAMFYKVAETLTKQGFDVLKLSQENNPVYAIKYASAEAPIICFSKKYDDAFNPQSNYGAVVTCNSADENCPVVFGAEQRFPIKYNDPKAYDNTDLMDEKYFERSLEIAQEMWWVMGEVGRNDIL